MLSQQIEEIQKTMEDEPDWEGFLKQLYSKIELYPLASNMPY